MLHSYVVIRSAEDSKATSQPELVKYSIVTITITIYRNNEVAISITWQWFLELVAPVIFPLYESLEAGMRGYVDVVGRDVLPGHVQAVGVSVDRNRLVIVACLYYVVDLRG